MRRVFPRLAVIALFLLFPFVVFDADITKLGWPVAQPRKSF